MPFTHWIARIRNSLPEDAMRLGEILVRSGALTTHELQRVLERQSSGRQPAPPLGTLLVNLVGGLLIGMGEKLSEVYFGPIVGGGIENWFAYVLCLFFLLVRPEGLFGEKHIDRV